MQDAKQPLSSKGKAREDTHWQLGWWDLSHSLEGTRRPLVWSKSSVIFTAHPTDPLIIGRHFSSSKQFAVSSPSPVLSSPASYDPPTVVSVSPTDDWLFAYFPGRGGDGAGCLWKRGLQLDSWVVREWWSFPPGAGAVVAEWTCSQREWMVADTGSSSRLPPRGPLTPLSSLVLLLVTQNHQINVCYLPPYVQSLKIMRVSLIQASKSFESQPSAADDTMSGLGGQSICVTAAIGMGYNESSILVAMRSHVLPSHNVNRPAPNSMVLDLSLDIAQSGPSSEIPLSPEWELWGEESTVQLCEVNLSFKAHATGVITRPLPPIFDATRHLTNLVFVAVPPVRTSTASPEKRHDTGKAARSELYLAVTFLDFADYVSVPKSEIMLYALNKDSPFGSKSDSIWVSHAISRQTFEDRVLDFVLASPSRDSLLVGFMNLTGTVTTRKGSVGETNIGRMVILKIPDLSLNTLWDEAPMLSITAGVGRQVLANVAYSPNRSLICSVSPSTSMNSHISIHGAPHNSGHESSPKSSLSAVHSMELSHLVVAAIRSRNSPSDLIHPLTLANVSTETIVDTLCNVLKLLQSNLKGAPESCIDEVLGLAVEIYSRKARRLSDVDKENLDARWKAAHDILSLGACCSGFEECQDGPAYDLDAVWQLIGLASWFIEFVENILRECVLVGDGSVTTGPAASSFMDIPIFIHLAHPHPLGRMKTALSHVKRFRDHIAKLSAKGEHAQIAKDVLMDIVDSSGVDLDQLGRVLNEVLQDLQPVDVNGLHKSLIACCPPPYLGQHLRKAIGKIVTSNVINRSRLFIKPGDLVDGVSRLSLTERHAKEKRLDVISKALLLPGSLGAVCVRCEGISQVGLVDMKKGRDDSLQWRLWERRWATSCVCGGSWVKSSLG